MDEDTNDPCWVMLVAQHKNARQGPASITLTKEDHSLTSKYTSIIRPTCSPTTNNLFVSINGQPIQKLNDFIQWLGSRYGIATPTCTQLRKVAATETAMKCDEPMRHVVHVTAQMSHSDVVHTQHYERLRGSIAAAVAHKIRQQLLAGDNDSDEPSNSNDSAHTSEAELP